MTFSPAVLAAHERLSRTQAAFLRATELDPGWARRAEFADLHGAIPETLQPWPTFIGRSFREELARASVGLFRILKTVPARVFGGDPSRFAAFFPGGEPSQFAGLLENQRYLDDLIARADFVVSRDSVKCVEFNVSAALGGWDLLFAVPRLVGHPLFQRFQSERGFEVSAPNQVALLLDHIFRRLLARGSSNFDIVLVPPEMKPGEEQDYGAYLEYEYSLAEARFGRTGGSIAITDWGSMSHDVEDGTWSNRGHAVGAVIQFGVTFPQHPGFVRSIQDGTTVVLNGPLGTRLADKRLLAFLSDGSLVGLTGEEQATIDAHLPWTRIYRRGRVRYGTVEAELVELAEQARTELVLKPGNDFGGLGVTIGAEVSPNEWTVALRSAMDEEGLWVLQERVQSERIFYQRGENGSSEHNLALGVFLLGDTCTGTSARVMPVDATSVVNVARGAEKSIVLEVED